MTRYLIGGLLFCGVFCITACPGVPPQIEPPLEICIDGVDNDLDGAVDCNDSDCAQNEACLAPFVFEAETFLTPENTLALQTSLPALVSDCVLLPVQDAPCTDNDLDGLVDVWETLVLERFQPLSRLDEDEGFFGDASGLLANVGRVALIREEPLQVHVFIMLGYSRDYGSCLGVTSHNGDSERVALALVQSPGGGDGDVEVFQAYTAAHEGEATDRSQTFTGAELSSDLRFTLDPETAEPRWVVFPSQDKHATYANVDLCEGASNVPCVEEDCNPDGVDPLGFDIVPAIINAGEEDAQLIDELSSIGFPGESAWGFQEFCGGLGGDGCASPVREKLLDDPFLPL